MVLKTKNSTYEVDSMKIRRVSGINPPTNHFSPDGEWKTFKDINELEVGYPICIMWTDNKYTITSRIESIENAL